MINNNSLNAMDILNVLSFYISLKNLDLNISQSDLQEETKRLDKQVDEKVRAALIEIHEHLEMQDKKLDYIISLLEEEKE